MPGQTHVEDDQRHHSKERKSLHNLNINYRVKFYLPVDEEGCNCQGPEGKMGKVVGHEFHLLLEVRGLAVWDNVVERDVPEQVEQAAEEAKHQDPNWKL